MKGPFLRCAVFASCLGAVALQAMISTSKKPHSAVRAEPQQAGLPLSVLFDESNLDANTQRLYRSMQDSINGFAITPADRIAYYSAVNNINGYVINGWQGIITNVQRNAGGYLVSIDVVPCLSSDREACAVVFNSDYAEQYQVFPDGTFRSVGALDPQGQAGRMPAIVGL